MNVPATVGLVLVLVGVSALLPWAFRTIAAAWRKRRRTRELAVLAAAARMSVVRQRPMIPLRISAVFGGVTYRLFTGFADAWTESPVTRTEASNDRVPARVGPRQRRPVPHPPHRTHRHSKGTAMNERLMARIAAHLILDDSGCVLWAGARDSNGYGRVSVMGRNSKVHRIWWQLLNGPIPDGLQLDHLCRVRHCANVAHLELVTNRTNALRGLGPTAINARKTHCPRGHEYDMLTRHGRWCSTCVREYNARRDRKRPSAATGVAS